MNGYFLTRLMAAACLLMLSMGTTVAAQTGATVSVNAASVASVIPTTAFGVNTAVWDGRLRDAAVPPLLAQAGVAMLRYPGGSTADVYHWLNNSSTAGTGQYVNPNNTFDAFMTVAQSTGAAPIITVNYGSNAAGTAGGDPSEAADWVNYANNTKHYGIKYWEIGNEIYGNGEYGATWEKDLHADHSPSAYGQNAALFIAAMKAKDPTIKVGVVLTAPGNWPDTQTPNWNAAVLAACGAQIDFVIVHWYPQEPGSETDARLLASTSGISGMVSKLRSLITQYCGANAASVQILLTETNSVSSGPGKQTVSLVNALFLADNFCGWLENGITSVDWWDLHNGASTGSNNSASLYGSTTYGDYGMLSSGNAPAPAANLPFAPYYGLQMLTYLGKPGDRFATASSNQALLSVHAVKQANGSLALLLINKDPANSCAADITVSGFTPASSSKVYFYGIGSSGITQSTGSAGQRFLQTVPPYSLTTVVLQPVSLAQISGTVTLQGCASNAQPLVFALTPTGSTGGGTVTQSLTPSAAGAFTMTGIAAGTYKLGVKGGKWLRRSVAVDTTGGSVAGVNISLLGGDVTGDNQITGSDLATVRKAYNSSPGSANWNATADLNGDGQVTMTDLSLLRGNYGRNGDQ